MRMFMKSPHKNNDACAPSREAGRRSAPSSVLQGKTLPQGELISPEDKWSGGPGARSARWGAHADAGKGEE